MTDRLKWVTATHLDRWSDTRAAQGTLPDLVRRLIDAGEASTSRLDMPSGDVVNRPGWDGRCRAPQGTAFVPVGDSVWEMSSSKDPIGAAEDNFGKRSANPLHANKVETTFTFVTSRIWDGKSDWEHVKSQTGEWHEVRAFDARDLEQWIAQTPPAAVWLAEELNIVTSGVQSPHAYWDEWRTSFSPPATERLVLAGRLKEADVLVKVLQGAPQSVMIQADSEQEALAFAVASLRANEEFGSRLLERMIVAREEALARDLTRHTGFLVAIVDGAENVGGHLVSRGNRVIVPVGYDDPNATVRLSRATSADFAEALCSSGIERAAGERLAYECGRSVTVLRRLHPSSKPSLPAWADPSHTRDLLPAMLAGGWDEASELDREVLSLLAGGADYGSTANRLLRWVDCSDPMFRRAGSVWRLVSPVDALALLSRYIGPSDWDRLGKAVARVLGEPDPALELPADKRPFASIYGQTRAHSSWLRAGLAENLLVLASQGFPLPFGAPGAAVEALVSQVLRDADWRRWASLNDQLPRIAEAAPRSFLRALDDSIEGRPADFRALFVEDGSIFAHSYHTGLLWALEVLAWDPGMLAEVTRLLGRLAVIDPGGRLANRPINTLKAIFLPWMPGTSSLPPGRASALQQLVNSEPEVGWRVLLALLPDGPDAATRTARPRWRDLGAPRTISWGEYFSALESISLLLANHAGSSPQRLADLASKLGALTENAVERARRSLSDFESHKDDGESSWAVWDALRDFVFHQEAGQGADWAVPEAELARWRPLVGSLAPTDVVGRYRWLFDHSPRLPVPYRDWAARDAEIAKRRKAAMNEVFKEHGALGIVSLARSVKAPRTVAWCVPDLGQDYGTYDSIVDAAWNDDLLRGATFVSSVSAALLCADRTGWTNHVTSRVRAQNLPIQEAVELTLFWPDDSVTWGAIADFGAAFEAGYWSRKPALPLGGSVPAESLTMAVSKLLTAGRAVDAVVVSSHRASDLPTDSIFAVLDALLQELSDRGAEPLPQGFDHDVRLVFETLAGKEQAERLAIARYEFQFLPLLVSFGSPSRLVLFDLLGESPELFVELLGLIYRREGESSSAEPTEFQRNQASAAYRLLDSWVSIPGATRDGSIESGALSSWVNASLRLADERGLGRPCRSEIGKLLAHSPEDSDGLWPHRAVRAVIEEERSRQIEEALRIERFNMRGVVQRSFRENGEQERVLASRERAWQAGLASGWPRCAALLGDIAQMWEEEGQRRDIEALKEGLSE